MSLHGGEALRDGKRGQAPGINPRPGGPREDQRPPPVGQEEGDPLEERREREGRPRLEGGLQEARGGWLQLPALPRAVPLLGGHHRVRGGALHARAREARVRGDPGRTSSASCSGPSAGGPSSAVSAVRCTRRGDTSAGGAARPPGDVPLEGEPASADRREARRDAHEARLRGPERKPVDLQTTGGFPRQGRHDGARHSEAPRDGDERRLPGEHRGARRFHPEPLQRCSDRDQIAGDNRAHARASRGGSEGTRLRLADLTARHAQREHPGLEERRAPRHRQGADVPLLRARPL